MRPGLFAGILLLLLLPYQMWLRPKWGWIFPEATGLVFEDTYAAEGSLDVAGLLVGARRAVAGIAWIQVLQYYAGWGDTTKEESPQREKEGHFIHAGGYYPRLSRLCLRAVRLDPRFHQAVIFGAASLAGNMKEYEEAAWLLREGYKLDPAYPYYATWLAGIAYQRAGDSGAWLQFLEEASSHPDFPVVARNILGNLYIKLERWHDAERVFQWILDHSRDAGYRSRAQAMLELIRQHHAH